MGRIVGDGGCFAQVVDMAVAPEWQGQGLGRGVLEKLLGWAENHLPACCHLSLVSAPAAEPLYRDAGFERCLGMDRYVGSQRLSPALTST
jgi:GNAT superfamily N-acetyltransferase